MSQKVSLRYGPVRSSLSKEVALCKSQGVSLNRHTLKVTRDPGQPLLDMTRDRAAEYSSASSNRAEVLQLPAPTLATTSLQRTPFEASPRQRSPCAGASFVRGVASR